MRRLVGNMLVFRVQYVLVLVDEEDTQSAESQTARLLQVVMCVLGWSGRRFWLELGRIRMPPVW